MEFGDWYVNLELKILQKIINLSPEDFVITNNPYLENIDSILNMCTTPKVQILNNPKLNVSAFCDSDCFDKEISQIAGNLGNCGEF